MAFLGCSYGVGHRVNMLCYSAINLYACILYGKDAA